MSQDYVEKILGRLLTDDEFRHAAEMSLLDVCAKYGYVLTYHEYKILQNMDFNSFVSFAKYLDRGIKRCGKVYKGQVLDSLSDALSESYEKSVQSK